MLLFRVIRGLLSQKLIEKILDSHLVILPELLLQTVSQSRPEKCRRKRRTKHPPGKAVPVFHKRFNGSAGIEPHEFIRGGGQLQVFHTV